VTINLVFCKILNSNISNKHNRLKLIFLLKDPSELFEWKLKSRGLKQKKKA